MDTDPFLHIRTSFHPSEDPTISSGSGGIEAALVLSLCFYTAFRHHSCYFFLFDVGNGGAFFSSVVVVCSPPFFTVWI